MKKALFVLLLILASVFLFLVFNSDRTPREAVVFLEAVEGTSVLNSQPIYQTCNFQAHDVAVVDRLVIENKTYGYYLVNCSPKKKTYIPVDQKIMHKKLWL